MYKIWKHDMDSYWVERLSRNGKGDYIANKLEKHSNLLLLNCRFIVDHRKYDAAKQVGFNNSGDPQDYFAWIEALNVIPNPGNKEWIFDNKLYFNPHKSLYFKDRDSDEILLQADFVSTVGNILYYNNAII